MDKIKRYSLVSLVFLAGCAYYQPIGVSSTSIGSQYERPVGLAEGHAIKWYYFPCYALCQAGEDSIKAAINNALVGKHGDTLANVFVERKTTAFPHALFPVIVRSEIIVTGTVVKYLSKEFPPDNEEYLYSTSPSVIWDGLLLLKPEDQARRLKLFSYGIHESLMAFAGTRECLIKSGEPAAVLFQNILGRAPRACPEYKIQNSTATSASVEPCKLYYCMTLLPPQEQIVRITELRQAAAGPDNTTLSDIVKAGQKRIRACRGGQIYVNPEVILAPGEQEFLTYLCHEELVR